MTHQTLQVKNKVGLHARPVALLIKTVQKYNCRLEMTKGDTTTDMRSIVNLLSLQVKMGDEVIIHADGKDEEQALQEVVALINSKFGEE